MKIKAITKYVYKGKEYNSLIEIKESIHNTIGLEVLDKINRVCPPMNHKDLFKMLDVLCSKEVREVLIDCFSVEMERELDDFGKEFEVVNVLDVN